MCAVIQFTLLHILRQKSQLSQYVCRTESSRVIGAARNMEYDGNDNSRRALSGRPSEELPGCQFERQEAAVAALSAMSFVINPTATIHQHDVGLLAAGIVCELGFAEAIAFRIEMACRVHDIGLNGVDPRIIDKDEPLTEHEYNILRLHPERGADILAATPALADLAPIVRSHHERVDGRGYPDGLFADEIPLESRVLAVADAFHAMTTAQHWRNVISPFTAVQELLRAAGSQFDSAIVNALIRTLGVRSEPDHVEVRRYGSQRRRLNTGP
jgi:HD-GYP domain-containing protein (c-di-GMP phosphodiesterase class II)